MKDAHQDQSNEESHGARSERVWNTEPLVLSLWSQGEDPDCSTTRQLHRVSGSRVSVGFHSVGMTHFSSDWSQFAAPLPFPEIGLAQSPNQPFSNTVVLHHDPSSFWIILVVQTLVWSIGPLGITKTLLLLWEFQRPLPWGSDKDQKKYDTAALLSYLLIDSFSQSYTDSFNK